MKSVGADKFYHDGRGPELKRVHWDDSGSVIRCIDYFNPDDEHTPERLKRVTFKSPQVVMITPEEVINYDRWGAGLVELRPASAFDLGRSDWLASFAPTHLERCRHYQLFFYDDLVDVIAEGIQFASVPADAAGYVDDE